MIPLQDELSEQYSFALRSVPKFVSRHVASAAPLKFAHVAPLAVIAVVNMANPV